MLASWHWKRGGVFILASSYINSIFLTRHICLFFCTFCCFAICVILSIAVFIRKNVPTFFVIRVKKYFPNLKLLNCNSNRPINLNHFAKSKKSVFINMGMGIFSEFIAVFFYRKNVFTFIPTILPSESVKTKMTSWVQLFSPDPSSSVSKRWLFRQVM